jgi:H+/Cl- antiporter ClcA
MARPQSKASRRRWRLRLVSLEGKCLDIMFATCATRVHKYGLATLLPQPTEAVLNLFYDRDHAAIKILTSGELFLCLLVYFVGAIGIAGVSVPAGNFVPSMFMGALLGRLFRQKFVPLLAHDTSLLAERGLYAMCGSASVLAGFTHMTVAIVAMLTEAWGDIRIAKEGMLSACIGLLVKKWLAPLDYCAEPRCPRKLVTQLAWVHAWPSSMRVAAEFCALVTHGNPSREGSVAIVGTVSPLVGDFTGPLTSSTLSLG